MTEVQQLMDYYVSVDDGDHMYIVSNNDHIFEALSSFYETIHEGPSTGIISPWLSVEMGEIIFTGDENLIDGDEHQEPLLYHEFPEAD